MQKETKKTKNWAYCSLFDRMLSDVQNIVTSAWVAIIQLT